MFETLIRRAAERAEARAAARREEIAARIEEAAPQGVAVAVEDQGVAMSGRGLAARFMTDPALRWLVAEKRDGR
jgi:hypothetical protein